MAISANSVHIFSMQKDANRTLFDWMNYHGKLVGYDHIHLINHMPEGYIPDRHHSETMASFARKGVDISIFEGSFEKKASAISLRMKSLNYAGNILVPLDVDEFIVLTHPLGNFTVDRDRILKTFRELPVSGKKFKFAEVEALSCGGKVDNRLVMQATHFRRSGRWSNCYAKTFYPGGKFVMTDQGNHHGAQLGDDRRCSHNVGLHAAGPDIKQCEDCFHFSNLGLAHFGATALDFDHIVYKNRQRIIAYAINVEGYTHTDNCSHINGIHYCTFAVTHKLLGHTEMERRWTEQQKKICENSVQLASFSNFDYQ